jgi:putative hydrolase of the HAD superfamily
MSLPIRAVAFDAVGTLIDPSPPVAEVYHAVGERHGSALRPDDIRRRFRAAFARQDAIDAAAGLATSEARERERWRAIVAEVLDDVSDPGACFTDLYDHFARPDAWTCDIEAGELLTRLQRDGYALAVASNFDHRLRGVVAGLPALAPIRHFAISSEIGWRKPSPQFFTAMADLLGLPAAEILLVGDDFGNDFEGGRNAGLPVVLLDPANRHGEVKSGRIERLGELRVP